MENVILYILNSVLNFNILTLTDKKVQTRINWLYPNYSLLLSLLSGLAFSIRGGLSGRESLVRSSTFKFFESRKQTRVAARPSDNKGVKGLMDDNRK